MEAKSRFVPHPAQITGNNALSLLSGDTPLFFDPALSMSDALYIRGLIDSAGENDALVMARCNAVLREIRHSLAPHQQSLDLSLYGLQPARNFAPTPVSIKKKRVQKKKRKPAKRKKR
jgi:hypothetical protein